MTMPTYRAVDITRHDGDWSEQDRLAVAQYLQDGIAMRMLDAWCQREGIGWWRLARRPPDGPYSVAVENKSGNWYGDTVALAVDKCLLALGWKP